MQYKVGRTLAKSNYTETDLANFRKTASMYGVNVVTFSDKQEFVEYINDKDGENSRAEVLLRHGQLKRHQIIMKNLFCNQMLLLHKKTCRLICRNYVD